MPISEQVSTRAANFGLVSLGAGQRIFRVAESDRLARVDVVLRTSRMLLRRFTRDDLELLVELDSDPEVKRFIDNGAPVDRDVESEMLDWWLGYSDRGEKYYGFYAAIEQSSGEFIGWFHLRPGEHSGPTEPELGYRLRRVSWGRGYATEGSRALVDWAFESLGADRVNAETMAINVASRRVMEKAGLRFVRNFRSDWPVRIPGDEHGDVEYAITRAEWEADGAPSRAV